MGWTMNLHPLQLVKLVQYDCSTLSNISLDLIQPVSLKRLDQTSRKHRHQVWGDIHTNARRLR
jgi:hypothetical protein